jgi:hypothetical protein
MRSALGTRGVGLSIMVGLIVFAATPVGALATARTPPGPGLQATSGEDTGVGQTVADTALGVTWLADANLARKDTFKVAGINADGSMDYQTAVSWVAAMNADDYLGHDTWRLPATPSYDPGCSSHNTSTFGYGCSQSAMGSLYYTTFGLDEPATAVPVHRGTAGPFNNFQPYLYWTSTIAADPTQGYRTFSFNTGWQGTNVAKHNMYVLPMVPGNPFSTAVEAGQALDASADGRTVYDPATNVTWLANADLAKKHKFGVAGINRDGSMEQQTATTWVAAMDSAAWLGASDWQLPTSNACGGFDCSASLLGDLYYDALGYSQGEPVVATPNTTTGGFHDLQPYLYWSCSTVSVPCSGSQPTGSAWSFSFGNGFEGTDLTQNDLYVMVYYPTPTSPPPTKPVPPHCHGSTCD